MLDSIKTFFVNAWRFVKSYLVFDPDRDWRSLDKMQHLLGGFGVRLAMELKEMGWEAIFWSSVIFLVYELGQTDVARSLKKLGQPGYGIGLVDLAYDEIGMLLAIILLAVSR